MKNVWWAVTVALCVTATGAWAGGEEETEAAAAEPREMVEDATTGKMLLAPRYGGSISYAAVGSPPSSDTWYTHHSNNAINGVNESLAIGDWGIDRNVYAFDTDVVPVSVMIGQLAESWTMPDDVTVVFTIRDNVFWRDRPPTNGRQLTAHDIVYNWHRYLGLGQFAEQGISPSLGAGYGGFYESITATDDRTVVFKLPQPRLDPLYDILFQRSRAIYAPEVIEEHGDVQDWRNNVGTGPFDLVEWVEESVMVWNKVDDYWGFDEKFPDNRLPYIDEVRAIFMKEPAARIAAIRTRQVDHLGSPGNTQINSVDDANALRKSNPELQFFRRVFRCETCIGFNIANEPFDDINVRRAMQMAFDLEGMNNDFFDGQADWEPEGRIGRGAKEGYFTPFSESVFVKQPGLGASIAWHQDGTTHWDSPQLDAGTHGFNFMAQIYPTTPENGLWLVPGTHCRGKIDIKALVAANGGSDRLPGAVPMVCQPGDIALVNRQILHGAYANRSDRRRVSLTFGFHRRASVAGVVGELPDAYDDERIHRRAQVVALAIDARRQRFPGEPQFVYQPLAAEADANRWTPANRAAVLPDYEQYDLGI